eukprot:CAMPEP_0197008824 /NCGR_PEP_ID=MMETSP1380-20130617/47031_1 /TAXON_ID=5936 /ORGANISM="Euplotes crassus, Strain CT5" /LENGTH=280 /DNA_ID=CAMNT_0042429641 /DNA_START=8 /DNA_END=850 /DNA_ORIENTATION=+
MTEINVDIESYTKRLTNQEFDNHLDDCNGKFRDDIMRKVFMLKVNDSIRVNQEINNIEAEKESRVDELRGEMRVLENECYDLKKHKKMQEVAIKRELDSIQRQRFLRPYFRELKTTYIAAKNDKKYNEEWCRNFRNKNLLKMIIKFWKYFTFNKGNKEYENRMKQRVENIVQNELQDKRVVVEALEAAVRELEEQKALEIKKKTIVKAQLDQAYLRGASSTSLQALKMGQGTLNTLYAGVKMPRYTGNNLLAQINLLRDDSVTVTKKVIASTVQVKKEEK